MISWIEKKTKVEVLKHVKEKINLIKLVEKKTILGLFVLNVFEGECRPRRRCEHNGRRLKYLRTGVAACNEMVFS